jgi:hypothetical protein
MYQLDFGYCDGKNRKYVKSREDRFDFTFKTNVLFWSDVKYTGDIPTPRSHHASCLVDYRYMYIIGGRNNALKYNDVYVFDFLNFSFKKIEVTGTKLPCLYGYYLLFVF